MLGFPPKPTSILPYKEGFNPWDYIAQPKYRGWRVVVHNNRVYTRKGNLLPIETDYPTPIEYQIDGELINPAQQIEYKVPTAIKDGTWRIELIDIYVPSDPNMILLDRLKFMEGKLGLFVMYSGLTQDYEEMFRIMRICQRMGWEGAVIKRKDSIYKISEYASVIDHDWFKLK